VPVCQITRKRFGQIIHHGSDDRFDGARRVNAVKGIWQADHTFVIGRLVLGQGQPAERWTLTFDGEKLNVRAKIGEQPEISIDSEGGG
jgi:hypothetical protein